MYDYSEPILDADLEIIDAHHHLWFLRDADLAQFNRIDSVTARSFPAIYRQQPRYLFEEYLADASRSGHNVRASVFVDSHAMYRARGSDDLKSVGEVEFANGVAAMADSGLFGEVRVCAGIVGGIDLNQGDAVAAVLSAQVEAGGRRYRGVRSRPVAYDEDESILGVGSGKPHVLMDERFRAGFRWLKHFNLCFDAFLLEPQLLELIDLARSFIETQIVLNHTGTPLGVGRYQGRRDARFNVWRENIRKLAQCGNVAIKLGGLGTPFGGFEYPPSRSSVTSQQLATMWKPYIETSIEAFGVDRCMFESNFPVDRNVCTYATLWNAFKRLTAGASSEEKAALFSGTARRVYRLDV